MALDGLVVASIVHEFNSALVGGKIEKVYQPEIDELTLLVRSNGNNYRLLLSVNSNFPRAHISNISKVNPDTPPSFCMLLRKHLQNGRITKISQPNMERIIILQVETLDELNLLKVKHLIIEIMGKHSNIILVDEETNKIIDSIKRISLDISRHRQVLPGLTYRMPPSQEKKNPQLINSIEAFNESLPEDAKINIHKGLYYSFTGLSPLIAAEICFRSQVENNTPILALTPEDLNRLYNSFKDVIAVTTKNSYNYNIYIDEANEKFIDFSCVNLTHLSIYSYQKYDTASDMLENYYRVRDTKDRIKQKSQDLRKNLQIKLDRLNQKLNNLRKDLSKAEKAEEYKIKGDLITSNLHLIKDREESITIVNYYDPNLSEVTVQLDKKLTASQNAQKYYKQYNKYKTALIEVAHQVEITKEEISYIEEVFLSIENSTNYTDLEEIQNELIETGYVKSRGKSQNKKKAQKKSGFLRFLSSDGFEILVGKNNHQNDEITFKVSSKNDLWLHVKDLAGSHTILKVKDGEYSNTALLEAATLAAYYSKGKNSTKVAVDYTQRKNVKKPSGAKPGMVIYDNYQTIYVDALTKELKGIKEI
ncbi:fibronectin/fibrinogen-binding protein [Alkaliphilus pronyensis]|uniref:Rqc2 homolog RqcH n=1 Tax=Alkaliphilus pronyensis TaxID=1482732 RepID=A0A6I0F1V1_9FIRM|nr:NFACT RNA binding domain-containing protein [Alkaliphilus pronyensis]KAB3535242.1 fibronectin/fibrinogen-binding protein [Alkaliphilus pronyensis]